MVTVYFGEYTVTSYAGNVAGGGTYTAAATNGCFEMILEQPVGGTTGQSSSRYALAATTPSPNAFGDGEPNEPGTENETFQDSGVLASFTLTGLTATSGTGSLSFTNGAGSTATGTITITGSKTIIDTVDAVRRRLGASRRGMFVEAR